jgi:large subunit ribosomal protein L13e
MVRHNNVIPNQHFHKKWQFYVKTWFNQPARKTRRQNARAEKAKRVFPRPVAGSLRPIVHGQTVRYNMKKRYGRGFTLDELKEAGIAKKLAPTIGIAVDHRRRNRSLESLQANVARLKAYKSKLVLFPRRVSKPKQGDASTEDLKTVQQNTARRVLPLEHEKAQSETVTISADMKAARAYYKLRLERTNAKLVGMRAKRAAEAAAEEKDKAK